MWCPDRDPSLRSQNLNVNIDFSKHSFKLKVKEHAENKIHTEKYVDRDRKLS
jgi:hypothetical protein